VEGAGTSHRRLNRRARPNEVTAAIHRAEANVGEQRFGLGHGQSVLKALDSNVDEERFELSRPGFEAERLGVTPEIPSADPEHRAAVF
jgi:hypothetical protein